MEKPSKKNGIESRNYQNNRFVEVKNVWKRYGQLEILKGINLNVKKGDTVVIIGPSGGGKSTLLRCLHALIPIDDGEILLDGELIGFTKKNGKLKRLKDYDIAKQRTHIGMVFQHFNIFPHFNVINNIMESPIHVKKMSKEEAYTLAMKLLKKVNLQDKRDSFPNQLSGGQKQRVAIARALAMQPKLMLYDEATSALDPELIGEVLTVMKDISKSGMTSIVVTHEIPFAREVADIIYFLCDGEIVEKGPPDQILNNPKNERTKFFLKSVL